MVTGTYILEVCVMFNLVFDQIKLEIELIKNYIQPPKVDTCN